MAKVFQLSCAVQQYAWGKIGEASAVAQFAASGISGFEVDGAAPYAELWMGTHPKAPATIKDGSIPAGTPLGQWLAENPWALAKKVATQFEGKLPFLFKVLSVNKALSIQAHPHKELAVTLHASDPAHYPDDNHKPEMTIALTPFEGMCGFRVASELAAFLASVPELKAVVGEKEAGAFIAAADAGGADEDLSQYKGVLKVCFSKLMRQDPELVKTQLASLVARLEAKEAKTSLDELLLRTNTQYPGDVGCFCIYFLNVVNLEVGDAMFLGPNEPHAYLAGDCIECMAASDNVIRAGCTPKFKDVDVLCDNLTYTMSSADSKKFRGTASAASNDIEVYKTPVPEFDVAKITLKANQSNLSLGKVDGPSIFIVTDGEGQGGTADGGVLRLVKGTVFYISANEDVTVAAGAAGLVIHRAFCELA